MRSIIILCFLLVACTAPAKQVGHVGFASADVYTCTGEGCFVGPPEAYTYIPSEERLKNLNDPNYSRDYNIKPDTPVSCQPLGCKSSKEAVGNKKTLKWFPCECSAAHNIPFKQVRCFRDFEEATELGYTKSLECEPQIEGGTEYFKGTKD